MIKAPKNKIIVEKHEETTAYGIILPEKKEGYVRGRVISVGYGIDKINIGDEISFMVQLGNNFQDNLYLINPKNGIVINED